MTGEKFTLMQYSISAILGLIEAEDFVISEYSDLLFGKEVRSEILLTHYITDIPPVT